MAKIDPRQIVAGLIRRGVPTMAALALAGNSKVESGWNPGINEISPLVPGSRGGFGLWQHTGPRRRQLEAFAAQKGADPSDVDTQLDFVAWELENTERRARDAIYNASTPEEAAQLVSTKFLRPGIPHLDRRIAATRELMGMGDMNTNALAYQAPSGKNYLFQPQTPDQPQENALRAFRPTAYQTDPRAFMVFRS